VAVEYLGKLDRIVFAVDDIEPNVRAQPCCRLGEVPFPVRAVQATESPGSHDGGCRIRRSLRLPIPAFEFCIGSLEVMAPEAGCER
jgi:hypothetical protein